MAEVAKDNQAKLATECIDLKVHVRGELVRTEHIPAVGFGTYQITGQECYDSVTEALAQGYRHIDTAIVYGNHVEVGRALKDSKIARKDIWLTTKIWPPKCEVDGVHSADACYEEGLKALKDLQVDYVDLLIPHFPGCFGKWPKDSEEHGKRRTAVWSGMQRLFDEGKVRVLGVSNFEANHITELCSAYDDEGNKEVYVRPAINQYEYHPYLQKNTIREANAKWEIINEAYSSLGQGKGNLMQDKTIVKIAQECTEKTGRDVSPAQVLLKWGLQRDCVILPKSVTKSRIIANTQLFDFELTNEQIDEIVKLNSDNVLTWDPQGYQ